MRQPVDFLPVASFLLTLLLPLLGCTSTPNPVKELQDIGTVPNPPGSTARDVGFSATMTNRSVWIFGDTFFSPAAADGFAWRSSSWSSTTLDETSTFQHALDVQNKPLQLLPHTETEISFNIAHRDEPRRKTPWPQAVVSNGERAIIFYVNMVTGPDGAFDFKTVSGSVATWQDASAPAKRIEPPLFSDEEPDWGAAALLLDGQIYLYACAGISKACKLARVPFDAATDRKAYSFYDGDSWSDDWCDAEDVFDGAPLFSVHQSPYLGKFVAIYMEPGANMMRIRTAPAPEGPWSDYVEFGEGLPCDGDAFDYALIAHPELARDNGAVEILSYTRTTGLLQQETRRLELRYH